MHKTNYTKQELEQGIESLERFQNTKRFRDLGKWMQGAFIYRLANFRRKLREGEYDKRN